jgi:hypothetical protein
LSTENGLEGTEIAQAVNILCGILHAPGLRGRRDAITLNWSVHKPVARRVTDLGVDVDMVVRIKIHDPVDLWSCGW